jgi:beta-fructofuranosidase
VPAGLVPDPAASETWRDPFVYRDPFGDGWHMLVTARSRGARRLDDGVLAHARSADLVSWQLGPPVSQPEGFGQIEVPQVRLVDGRPVLVFTCHPDEQAESRKQAHGHHCTWSVPGDSTTVEATTGMWDMARARPLLAEPQLFAAPLVQDRSGQWVLVGSRNNDPHGVTVFEITDPIPVELVDGTLVGRTSP